MPTLANKSRERNFVDMKCKQSNLAILQLSVFKHKAIQLSFLASLLIVVCIMLGCVDDLKPIIGPGTPDTVKVGVIVPFELQVSTRYGVQLAMSQINQEGGILGRPLELVIKDNKNNPELSAKLVEELITQDGTVALVGPNFSRNSLKAAPVAQGYGVPMVTTTSTNPSVTLAGDFIFMATFSDEFQGKVMADFAHKTQQTKTAALLIQKGDEYSEGLSQLFEENFTDLGGRIVASETYSAGDADFTNQLTALGKEAPDVIFMPGLVPEVPIAIKQSPKIPQKGASGITATFLGGDGWDDPDLAPMGGTAIEDSYFCSFFSPETQEEEARDFIRSYRSMYGIAPDGPAAMGYDAVKLIATAMRRAGSVEKTAIRDELAATRNYRGATTILSYDENRHPIKSAVIMRIKNGRVKFHQQIEP